MSNEVYKDLDRYIETLSKCQKLKESEAKGLCEVAKNILLGESNLLSVSSPVTVVGDVHGQFHDLLELFLVSGQLPDTTYLFLGDYVDRGYNSVETFLYLLALKVKYPTRLFLLRGNHESRDITQVYGFYDECIRKYGTLNVWKLCIETFKFLTLAALIDGRVLCVHGGLSPSIEQLDQISALNRVQELPQKGPISDLLWSDPEEVRGWGNNPRGAGYLFGPEVTNKFLTNNNLDIVARAHQLVLEGYKWHFRQKVITVWSAPNYCYRCGNLASVMQVHENMAKGFVVFEASPEERFDSLPKTPNPEYFM